MIFVLLLNLSLLEKKLPNISLILEALDWDLQVILFESVSFMVAVLSLIDLGKATLTYLFNNLILSNLSFTSIFPASIHLKKGFP
jgi:hypothetical protein